MRIVLIAFILFFSYTLSSQTTIKALKFIPQTSLKIGSQKPAIGGQFDLVAGIMFNNKYMAGLGGGYCTNMGMGGKTVPLYADARMYFSTKRNFILASKDKTNDFYVAAQVGIDINNNSPFKTGFLAACELAYKFDFIKIKEFKFPPFFAGINLEYNHSKFVDEYRNYIILDGYLKHMMFNLKVSFDIPAIKIFTKAKQ